MDGQPMGLHRRCRNARSTMANAKSAACAQFNICSMTKPAQADIDTVLHQRFPQMYLLSAAESLDRFYAANKMVAGQGNNKPSDYIVSLRASVDAARAELEAMRPEEVAKLAAASRARQAAQSAAAAAERRAKAEKKAAEVEAARFYNQPAARADFAFWCKAEFWTVEEAAALLLGRDPRVVKPSALAEELKKPTGFLQLDKPLGPARFHRDFDGLCTLIARASSLGGPRIKPQDLVAWAQATGAAVLPAGLASAMSAAAPLPAPEAPATATTEPQAAGTGTGKRWTPERLQELSRYREEHGAKQAALKFGITEQRVRKLLPKQDAKQSPASPFQGLTHRIK